MSSTGKGKKAAAMIGSLTLVACQTLASASPAVLVSSDAATLAALKSVLAAALGRATVDLGPGDPATSSAVSVLPRAPSDLEGRSAAMPERFDIAIKDGQCVVIRRETGEAFSLGAIPCRTL
jgi:hypothetical protein